MSVKKSIIAILLISLTVVTQRLNAFNQNDVSYLYDRLIFPSADILSKISEDIESKEKYLDSPTIGNAKTFMSLIDIKVVNKKVKTQTIDMMNNVFSEEEISYLANYSRNPIVVKYHELTSQHKSLKKAYSLLTIEERAQMVSARDLRLENSSKPKVRIIVPKIGLIMADEIILSISSRNDELKELFSINQACQTGYKNKLFNSSYIACGVGHNLEITESSKTFARIIWRGELFPRNIARALKIYSLVVSKSSDPESEFYYGVLAYNTFTKLKIKEAAACWIKRAANKNFKNAVSFFEDIKDNHSNLPKNCSLIQL